MMKINDFIVYAKAPLRIGLAGGGTDLDTYCNLHIGNVLTSTISMYVTCVIENREDDKIFFNLSDSNQSFFYNSKKFLKFDGKGDIFKAVYNRMIKDYIKKPLSFNLFISSDVETGSGLGGSSTFVVAMISAFIEMHNLPLTSYEIAKLAYEIEREELNIIGGAQDQYASTFGGFNFIEFFAKKKVLVSPLRIKKNTIDQLESSTVLYFTGLTRSANQIEKEKKNLLESEKSINLMHEIKNIANQMKNNLIEGNIKSFAINLEKSWFLKKKMTDSISNIELDKIYNLAKKNGAYSGKITGAGGGGFFFFIVDPIKKNNLIRILNEQQGRVFNFSYIQNGVTTWKIHKSLIKN